MQQVSSQPMTSRMLEWFQSKRETNNLFVHPSGQQQLAWTGMELVLVPRTLIFDVKGYYRFLGIDPHSDTYAVRQALRRKAFECHPDQGGSVEDFLFLQECRSVLLNPRARAEYDKSLPHQTWLTPDEVRDMVRGEIVRGNTGSPEEIMRELGISPVGSGSDETTADVIDDSLRGALVDFMRDRGFLWSFRYSLDDYDERSLESLALFHDLLLDAVTRADWKTYLRVGVKRLKGKSFEVERGEFGAVVFWLASGVIPNRRHAEVAVAYAASGCDYATMLTTLSKMARNEQERGKQL